MTKGYLDNAATTELCECSRQAMIKAMDCFGNPSSLHSLGTQASELVRGARETVACFIKAREDEILFTSGGTESDNLAIFGTVAALKRRGNRIVTTAFEHSAVLEPMNELEQQGFEIIRVLPDKNGEISVSALEEAINEKTILVSMMWINNEIGAIQPINEVKNIIARKGAPAYFHCDATQGFGKHPICPERVGIDLMTASAHKIHGPKGAGFLYVRKGVRILPLIRGGEQQRGIRPGTESVIGICGLAAAVADIGDMTRNAEGVAKVKKYIASALSVKEDVTINSPENGSEYLLNISVNGIRSETMLHFCESHGVYLSSGSACSGGKASHVLKSMGLEQRQIDSALRISFSKYSDAEDADMLISAINEARQTLIRAK